MWIRRTDFDALVRRVHDLERREEKFKVYDAVQAKAALAYPGMGMAAASIAKKFSSRPSSRESWIGSG
jgi:hypothetical protein